MQEKYHDWMHSAGCATTKRVLRTIMDILEDGSGELSGDELERLGHAWQALHCIEEISHMHADDAHAQEMMAAAKM